jgi:multidrug efflux pump subunit AcrA (membrane-fusion protein)
MRTSRQRRWSLGLAAGLITCGVVGVAPTSAQSVPVIVPSVGPIIVGITANVPSVIVGIPGQSEVHEQSGVTWSKSGRADVDIDVGQHHGQAAAQ